MDSRALIVTEENGKLVVIEGNRGLAAAKILRSPGLRTKLRATDLPTLSEKKLEALRELPVVRVAKREDAWPYIGFKHVNGPQKWRSYPKAQYIAYVKKATGASLPKIATQIGDQHGTVQELYRALMVIEQAEATGVYRREYVKGRFAFSHLTTALQYPNFSRFLKVKDASEESDKPVPPSKVDDLGELCRWLWGDKRDDTDRVVASQNPNLRQLEQVLGNPSALSTLRRGHGLAVAYDESKGEETVFADALQDARTALVKAQGRVSSGYSGDPKLLEVAKIVKEMATDLVTIMEERAAAPRPMVRYRRVRR
ncbi:MAG TPA: hypothetical protein VGI60_11075 [Chthoniobacterales bacterium]